MTDSAIALNIFGSGKPARATNFSIPIVGCCGAEILAR